MSEGMREGVGLPDGFDVERGSGSASSGRRLLSARRQAARTQSVIRAITYIEARFRESLTLADISGAAHVSRFHFARMFRAQIGMSPMQYVRWRRVQEAKRMLRSGRDSMASVAIDLGYFDHSHFTRTFRSITGMCPHQYLVAARPGGDSGAGRRRIACTG